MGVFASPLQIRAGYGPLNDYWYKPVNGIAASGIQVDADTAMRISAVWGCVRIIAESISSIPLPIYERLSDYERERATGYYLYDTIHDQPNRWQTSQEFREMLTTHALLRGNGYAQIVPGRRGLADQLIPLHPSRVTVEQQDENGQWRDDGVLMNSPVRYKVRQRSGTETIFDDSQIFHLRGLSNNGLTGMSVVEYARESFGLAMATESYGARLFSQDARPGGILEHPGKLSENAKKNLQESFMDQHAGLLNAHKPAVFEEGMKWHQLGMTNEDSQFLETRSFQIADIARWFRVPLHMIQETEKATSWGSGIEQLSLAFVIYTLLPWAKRWESAIKRDLIAEVKRYYAEHLFESLLRGDMKSRYEAYQIAAGGNAPWMTRAELRRAENLNRIEGMDEPLIPKNMGGINDPAPEPVAPVQPLETAKNKAHYDQLLHDAAARVVHKEIVAMSKAAKRCGGDSGAWRQAVDEFYAEHVTYMRQTLKVDHDLARWYVSEQKNQLLEYGAGAMEEWETERVYELVAMVRNDERAA